MIGIDVYIDSYTKIKNIDKAIIGNHVGIDCFTYISSQLEIGDYVHISSNVSVIGGLQSKLIMEDFTSISAGCRIICCSDNFNESLLNPLVPIKYRQILGSFVKFERFSAIGTNCIVKWDVTLAEGSIVGMGGVLINNTIPWGIYIGNPARLIGYRNKENILDNAKKLGYDY